MIVNPALEFGNQRSELHSEADVAVIGSGMGSLVASALLAKAGRKVVIFERNYLPGGCASSYKRKDYIFESGATTLVGLDRGMPLKAVLDITGIELSALKLEIPMKVILPDDSVVTRYNNLESWICEAERVFGKSGQRSFWTQCFEISQQVWSVSSRHLSFPPRNLTDVFQLLRNFRVSDIKLLPFMNMSLEKLMEKHGLLKNLRFLRFIDEQLIITAQNKHGDVDVLFGATSLCYTLFGNYYLPGGMIEMVKAFTRYIQDRGGQLVLREEAIRIEKIEKGFQVSSTNGFTKARYVLSGIPVNNLSAILESEQIKEKLHLRESRVLYSAFQAGLVLKSMEIKDCLHYQIHVNGLPDLPDCRSFFVSFSHHEDRKRCASGHTVVSVSLHIPDPANQCVKKDLVLAAIIEKLEMFQLIKKADLIYSHCSVASDWEFWTGRHAGFVGGYPQTLKVKPWQMQSSRLAPGIFLCGDTVYPGQGIPGVALSGLIAAEKIRQLF
ncbi:MAG: FAD-dependent oxidoreductase [Bacteroidetes bacterium]|nr:FAD-dependent oxidoreductase [Bacteroidota bacterium]